jgi:hypothetical protein
MKQASKNTYFATYAGMACFVESGSLMAFHGIQNHPPLREVNSGVFEEIVQKHLRLQLNQ